MLQHRAKVQKLKEVFIVFVPWLPPKCPPWTQGEDTGPRVRVCPSVHMGTHRQVFEHGVWGDRPGDTPLPTAPALLDLPQISHI